MPLDPGRQDLREEITDVDEFNRDVTHTSKSGSLGLLKFCVVVCHGSNLSI